MANIAFSSSGAFALAHYPSDTVDKVGPEQLAEMVDVVKAIVLTVATR